MSVNVVDIQVFGKPLRFNCSIEQSEALAAAADELNERFSTLREKTQISHSDTLALTVALNICYELQQEKIKNSVYTKKIESRLQLLESTIEKALLEKIGSINQHTTVTP